VAEDLTSETFFRALRAIKSYQHSGQTILAWLYRIASNQVTDHFRANRSTLPLEEAWAVAERDESGPEAKAVQADQQRVILAAVQKLSPDQQEVLLLRFSGGLRLKEIAETVGKSENAVKQLLFRALGNLKGRLTERGGP
jgi:RNA polymerase sigma-70 factor (ECF subfamily)